MEDRQAAEQHGVVRQDVGVIDLPQVGQDVAVRETNALRLARATTGEEQSCFVIATMLRKSHARQRPGGRQATDQTETEGNIGARVRRQEIGDIEDVISPREVRRLLRKLAAESAGGDDEVDLGPLKTGERLLATQREIEVHRNLAGKNTAQISHRRRNARRQHDRDTFGCRPTLQLTRESPAQGQQRGSGKLAAG